MSGQARRRNLRIVSAFLVVSITSSLGAPVLRAEPGPQQPGIPANPAAMTQTAKVALSDLWFAWVKQGGSSSVKPDRTFAFNFFQKSGANVQQAEILANNAQAAGQLAKPLPTSSSSITGWLKSKFGGNKAAAPTTTAAAPASGGGIMDRLKGMFSFGGRTTVDASPSSFLPGSNQPPTIPPPGTPGLAPGAWGDKTHAGLNKVGAAVHNVGQKVKGVAHDVGGGLNTALLTGIDKVDFRQFYSIPVSQNSAVKITGGSDYTVRFTNKGWTNQQVKTSTNLVDAIKANEATGQIARLETAAGPAQATSGPLGTLIGKFKSGLSSLKAKITGKPMTTPAEAAELSKYNIQGNLIEHAQGLTQTQKAIEIRINKLTTDATKLGRPVPVEEIANLKRTLGTVEAQKKDVIEKLQQVERGSAGSIANAGVKWAMYSVGITAGVNIINQVVSGEKVDFKRALSFVGQPSFWAGTAGGFLGSLVLTNVASALIPGGGIFMKILPGFLGAALGYEVGAGFFGGGSGDWLATIGQTLASAGGYALAYSLLGTGAPAIALIAAGIAGGALFNFIYSKFKNRGNSSMSHDRDGNLPPPDLGAPLPDPNAQAGAVGGQPAPGGGTQASPVGAGNLAALEKSMQQAYTDYINYLKDNKVEDSRKAFAQYTNAKVQLDKARTQAASATASNTQGR